jgi:ATP-dependent RNA helicase RhlE
METTETKGFMGLGVAPGILNVLAKLGFTTPTPIQEKSIPIAIEGKDMIGIAQTGTGKTLAFGIPLIQKMLAGQGVGLVIVPTRELATQVGEALLTVGTPLGFRTATLIGGEPIGRQVRSLARNPHVVIGTPGRLIDHLEQKTISFDKVSMLVLDEADRMLDMGFAPQLKRIMALVPRVRQTLLFSATMPDEIVKIARTYLQTPLRVEMARSGTAAGRVTQELFFVSQDMKPQLLGKILQDYRGSVLVFSRTKFGAKKIVRAVQQSGHTAAEIHSNRSLSQRREALEGFKTGKYRVLIATDIAARGIDVTDIELVVNYDLPENAEDYVHRIGRTGRASASGHAISFARLNQKADVLAIERLIRSVLPVSKLPEGLPPPPPRAPGQFNSQSPANPRRSFATHGERGARRPFRSGAPSRFSRGSSGPSRFGQRGKF